ncbi:MAG TPA: hypothetical protein VGF97_07085 [Rhizomicrobium sp.]|jgi:hypothetical protein
MTEANLGKKSRAPAAQTAGNERHRADTDSFIARNHEALDRSIRTAREELSAGKVSEKTIDTIIAEGRERHRA